MVDCDIQFSFVNYVELILDSKNKKSDVKF